MDGHLSAAARMDAEQDGIDDDGEVVHGAAETLLCSPAEFDAQFAYRCQMGKQGAYVVVRYILCSLSAFPMDVPGIRASWSLKWARSKPEIWSRRISICPKTPSIRKEPSFSASNSPTITSPSRSSKRRGRRWASTLQRACSASWPKS